MVRNNLGAGLIQNPNDVSLYIKDIVILCAVVFNAVDIAFFIIQRDQRFVSLGLPKQGSVHDMILGSNTVYRFAGTNAIGVVGIADTVTAMGDGGQPPAVLPSKR